MNDNLVMRTTPKEPGSAAISLTSFHLYSLHQTRLPAASNVIYATKIFLMTDNFLIEGPQIILICVNTVITQNFLTTL